MSDLPVVSTTLSLASVLAETARRQPDTVALIEGERRLTYAEVWDGARKLVADSVKPGDRVAPPWRPTSSNSSRATMASSPQAASSCRCRPCYRAAKPPTC